MISKEQIEELAKWCGFYIADMYGVKLYPDEKAWYYPDGILCSTIQPNGESRLEDFPNDLNACFKYIVPKAIQTIRVNEAIALRDAEERFFRKWLFMRDKYSQSDWTECLCLAVLKLIEAGI